MNTNKYLLSDYQLYLPRMIVKTFKEDPRSSFEDLMTNNSGSRYKILSGSSKFRKGEEYIVKGVYLDPHYSKLVCVFSSSCKSSCLINTGHMPRHQTKRYKLTHALSLYPEKFISLLIMEIAMLSIEASFKGVQVAIRFNGTSDIRIEKILNLALLKQDYPNVIFYDYTKYPLSSRNVSSSYHLTYSIDEQDKSMQRAKQYLDNGLPVAIVLNKEDYEKALQFPFVTDGETNDYRFKQGPEVVVLKAKTLTYRQGKYKENGIIRPLKEVTELVLHITENMLQSINQ